MLGTTNINAYSVYEQDNGSLCVVITSNEFNADSTTVVAARIIDEASTENDKFYHISYDAEILNTIVEKKILLDCQFNIKISRLKRYLYTLNNYTASQIRVALGKMIFGEEVFTIAEARNAIAKEELRMRIELEQKFKSVSIPNTVVLPTNTVEFEEVKYNNSIYKDNVNYIKELINNDKSKSAPVVYDNHSGIESLQNSFAKSINDEDADLDINYQDFLKEPPYEEMEDDRGTPEIEMEDLEFVNDEIEYDRIINDEYVPPFSKKFIEDYPECIEPYGIEHSIPVSVIEILKGQNKAAKKRESIEKAKKSKTSKCLNMSNGSIATIVTKKPKTEKKKYNSKYSAIYDNAANFLDQYINTEDKERMVKEYNLKDVKTLMNLASKCKKKLIEDKEFELLDIIGIDYRK